MAPSQISNTNSSAEEGLSHEFLQLLASLPKERGWRTPHNYLYQGFWCPPKQIQAIMAFQQHFQAQDTDLVIVTKPKTGTTWLKALVFAIVTRNRYKLSQHPLLTTNPHDLVPFLEYKLYINNQIPDLSTIPSPRFFATHVPYATLPESVKSSKCRILYVCRNPGDTFISTWHFFIKSRLETLNPFTLEEAFDAFCRGASAFGPFWDHVLGYWKKSLEKPEEVLFLRYEELKEDIISQMKRLAEFLGCPFSLAEESEGVIEEISKLCSFEQLSNLEVNKTGGSIPNFENKTLFRRGQVGDSVNYLTPSMLERLDQITEQKLHGSGLTFKVST